MVRRIILFSFISPALRWSQTDLFPEEIAGSHIIPAWGYPARA